MFTIEHEFDATIITLIDDAPGHRQADVTIHAFEECVTIEQVDSRTDNPIVVTLSAAQLRDLAAAMDLPEGAYTLRRHG